MWASHHSSEPLSGKHFVLSFYVCHHAGNTEEHDFGAQVVCLLFGFWQANAFSPYLTHNPANSSIEWRQQQQASHL
jgi:hypothetical protein